jgi:hypothetical protein
MNEQQWESHEKVHQMLEWLRSQGWPSERKLRLFAVACFTRVKHLCPDPRGQHVVEVAERYADGAASASELQAALKDAAGGDLLDEISDHSYALAALFSARLSYGPSRGWIHRVATSASDAVLYHAGATTDDGELAYKKQAAESRVLCGLLRDIIANPFRPPPPILAAVLQWNDGLVCHLAEQAYEHRMLPAGHLDPERLAVLADALEEAGANAEMVEHLRGPRPHVRGCYVVDLLTGRK